MPDGCAGRRDGGCRVCPVRARSELNVLDDFDLGTIGHAKRRLEYRTGEAVFAMGDANRGLYCLSAGVVAVRKLAPDGQSVLLSLAYPGALLGYRALLDGGEHKTSAETLGPAVVCRIDQGTISAVLRRNPELTLELLRRAVREVDNAHEAIVNHATLSNRGRLLHLLVDLLNRHSRTDRDGTLVLELPVSRRDLASMVGTRQETLSRIIGRIEEDGLAAFSGRRVRVPRLDPLLRELEDCRCG